jgi:hypothetical protein
VEDDKNQQSFVNDAFLSYSRKDREFAARLEKALEAYKPTTGLNSRNTISSLANRIPSSCCMTGIRHG